MVDRLFHGVNFTLCQIIVYNSGNSKCFVYDIEFFQLNWGNTYIFKKKKKFDGKLKMHQSLLKQKWNTGNICIHFKNIFHVQMRKILLSQNNIFLFISEIISGEKIVLFSLSNFIVIVLKFSLFILESFEYNTKLL